MHANAKYKDSVFSLLFSKPELLRELYADTEALRYVRAAQSADCATAGDRAGTYREGT